jgi:hypothetical protein
VVFQINRAIGISNNESKSFAAPLDQLTALMVERLEKVEGETVKPYHLDVYSDFIQLIRSRRV